MPSFDIVSETDQQKLDNAVNTARREIVNRYDFHNSKTVIELDKKEKHIFILTENDMRMDAVESILISRIIKQGLEPSCLDFGKEKYASGNMVKKDIKIKEGIDKDNARKIVKIIKDSGLKIQSSIMDEQVRVTGKKLDDLQAAIALVKKAGLDLPLQFNNFRN
jgi:cyclic-di-GMP-binding protein